eukprot:2616743-Rhodomonas_salina.1
MPVDYFRMPCTPLERGHYLVYATTVVVDHCCGADGPNVQLAAVVELQSTGGASLGSDVVMDFAAD